MNAPIWELRGVGDPFRSRVDDRCARPARGDPHDDRPAHEVRIALPTGASTTAPGRRLHAATARVAGGVSR